MRPVLPARLTLRVAAASVALLLPVGAAAVPTYAVAAPGAPTTSVAASAAADAGLARKKPGRSCSQGKRFRPTSLGIRGITRPRAVLALGRDGAGVPQAPPLSETGKRQLAWDAKDAIRAGAAQGVMKLNAHTYPDGSALGNTFINRLFDGDRIVVRGARGEKRCYEVVDRVQVTAEKRFKRYYRTDGRHRLAIAVCSGVRSSGGQWSHRTVWFAKPVR